MIIGGAAGAALGGPIGGLLGAAAGIAVEQGIISPARVEPDGQDRGRGVAFTVAVIALSAKMAKVDGVVTRDEIAAFRARVHIPPGEVAQVGRFWDLARQTPDGFESYARQVAGMFSPRAPVLEQLLDLLFHIAGSDAASPNRKSNIWPASPTSSALPRTTSSACWRFTPPRARNRGTFSASSPTFRMMSCAATGRRWCATIIPTG